MRVLIPFSRVLLSTVSANSDALAHSACVGWCVGKKQSSHAVLVRPRLAKKQSKGCHGRRWRWCHWLGAAALEAVL